MCNNEDAFGFIYNETEYYYVKNAQNDIIAIADADGTVIANYYYDAWGNPEGITGNTEIANLNPLRYRSYYFDAESGLYYLNTRYYSADICRFINSDSLLNQDHIIGFNLFAYCINNPVNMADTTGNLPFLVVTAAVGAVVGAVVGGVIAAKKGKNVWAGIGIGAVAGGLIGAGVGAAAGVLLAGSALASTTSVVIGAKAAVSVVGSAGLSAGVRMLADNVSRASSKASQVF